MEFSMNQPILVEIMQVFQIFEWNAAFFVPGAFLDSLISNFWTCSQIDDEIAINTVGGKIISKKKKNNSSIYR